MPQIIEIPGQGRVEFPDGMSDADIVSAIKRISAPAEKPTSPADGIGAFDAGLIAAGRSADKIVQGVRQMYNTAIGDKGTLAKMAADEAEKDALYKPLQQARPIATSIGEAIPAMAVPVGGQAGALATLGKAAMGGAIPGLLSYGSAGDRLKAGATGAIGNTIGAGIGMGVNRLLSPVSKAGGMSDEALAAADRLGLNLSAGQKTQNPALQNFENYLARNPGSSGAMQANQAANQTALNRAAAKAMGQNADDLSEGAFATAKDAIGKEFQRLQDVTKPKIGDDFLKTLATIDAENVARGPFRSKPVDSLIDKSLDLAQKGELSGKAYKEIRTQLSNESQSAFKGGDATLGQAYKAVRKALDDAAKSSLSEADQKAWDATRAQWMAYKELTRGNVAEAGNVSAARLASGLRRGGDSFRTGKMSGELADIARIGEAMKGVQNPNSGQLVNQMLYGNPLTGIPMMGANKLMQSAYTSKPAQAYLANGLADLGPNAAALIQQLALPLGAPPVVELLGTR